MADAPKPVPPAAKYEPQKDQPKTAQAQKNVGRPKRTPDEQAEYFYSKSIHTWFFLSSFGMLVSFVLMFWDDNVRDWKENQKVFAEMDLAKLQDEIKNLDEALKSDQGRIAEIDRQIKKFYEWFPSDAGQAKELTAAPVDDKGKPLPKGIEERVHAWLQIDGDKKKIRLVELDDLATEHYDKKLKANFAQSDYMAFRWQYEEAKYHLEKAIKEGDKRVATYEARYNKILPKWEQIVKHRDEVKVLFAKVDVRKTELEALVTAIEFPVNAIKKEKEDRVKALAEKQRRYDKEKPGFANTVRNTPVLDFFAPTIKIEQQVLPYVKEDLNFVKVERVDRCHTCHKGIGNPTYAVYEVDATGRFKDPLVQRAYESADRDVATWSNPNLKDSEKDKKLADAQRRKEDLDRLKGEFCDDFLRKYAAEKLAKGEWSLDDKQKYVTMFKAHPRLDLYVGSTTAHPLERIGCTVCHGGDGRETDFSHAVHTPNDHEQAKVWERRDHYHHRELWDDPMLPTKYLEASCRRCHASAVELDGAPEYAKAMRLYEKAGCYACHRTDAYQILPKDTADPNLDPNRKYRRPGPPFTHVKAKLTEKWAYKWAWHPKAFRPTTNMPRFLQQSNARTIEIDGVKVGPDQVEAVILDSIIAYIFANSLDRQYPDLPKLTGRVEEGKYLFKQVGCTACHRAEPVDLSKADTKSSSVHLDPFNFGPNLAGLGSKLEGEQGRKWLFQWLRDPQHHFAETRMPSLRLEDQELMDLMEFLLSSKNEEWEKGSGRPSAVNPKILDFLVLEQLKLKAPDFQARAELQEKSADRNKESLWLGEKMVMSYGCYSCHEMNRDGDQDWKNIEGIGVELTGAQPEGVKGLDKFDFGFAHYDGGVNYHGVSFRHGATGEPYVHRDPHNTGEKTVVRVRDTRMDWIYNKLLDPRVYDGGKMASKPPDELLRMPNFDLTEYEAHLLTMMVLSFTDHEIKELVAEAKKRMNSDEMALNRGHRLVRENNCRSCHRLSLDSFEIEWKRKEDGKDRVSFPWIEGRFVLMKDADQVVEQLGRWKESRPSDPAKQLYLYQWTSDHSEMAYAKLINPNSQFVYNDGREWWYLDATPDAIQRKYRIRSWRPQDGGDVISLIKAWKDAHEEELDSYRPGDVGNLEQRSPPMLRTQGVKTQADWLFDFLKNPHYIRPTLHALAPGVKTLDEVNIRMPNFGFNDEEAGSLVRYFWVRDAKAGVDVYPYTSFPERDEKYLEARKADYARIPAMLQTLCQNCHFADGKQPTGSTVSWAPEMANFQDRIRPRWLYAWMADPYRVYPGTTMLPNFGKFDDPKDFKEADWRATVEYMINWRRLRKP